ncbi:hypothetical protein EI74_0619 [Mycoplasma testudineum]|uniref:Uncharacterized protein n=1 Tax=Mycoplasma testudineum TaxID=244584 RepID=A0A4R6ID39_9MOLU|nr:hypothetical protein [Mycoplasma testudineum]OYD26685.1 hypothetical protein CG473_02700 [Mycoplasma testudineum]TDO19814.1 hypothetical protein EI74_0619 [Mycoplasma testudineum]
MDKYNALLKIRKNYKNIYSLVNLNFIQILSQFQILSEKFQGQMAEAGRLKCTYGELNKIYKIKSTFFEGHRYIVESKKMLIYVAEKAKYSALSFKRTDEEILELYKKNDLFIPIGDYAIEFAKKNGIPIYIQYETIDISHVEELQVLAYQLYMSKKIISLHMTFPTNKLEDGNTMTILPVKDFMIEQKDVKVNIKNVDIYPNLSDYIKNTNLIYLELTLTALIIEASFYSMKQKIIRIKTLLETVEDKIKKINNEILKEKRKTLTEEIIITTQ